MVVSGKKNPHTLVQKECFPLYELHWIEFFLTYLRFIWELPLFYWIFWSSKGQVQLVSRLSNFQPFLAYQPWRSQIRKAPKVGPSPIHNISQSSPCILLGHHRFIISCFVLKSHNVTNWDKQENHIYIYITIDLMFTNMHLVQIKPWKVMTATIPALKGCNVITNIWLKLQF